MATVDSIVDGLAAAVANVSTVDQVSTDTFTPAISTQSIAAMIVPFGQSAGGDVHFTLGGGTAEIVHSIPIEFWVKHVPGAEATTMQRARNVPQLAIAQLLASDGTGYDLAPEGEFTVTTESTFIEIGGQAYLTVTLTVPCRDEVTSA